MNFGTKANTNIILKMSKFYVKVPWKKAAHFSHIEVITLLFVYNDAFLYDMKAFRIFAHPMMFCLCNCNLSKMRNECNNFMEKSTITQTKLNRLGCVCMRVWAEK